VNEFVSLSLTHKKDQENSLYDQGHAKKDEIFLPLARFFVLSVTCFQRQIVLSIGGHSDRGMFAQKNDNARPIEGKLFTIIFSFESHFSHFFFLPFSFLINKYF
jgi:hypothetical protein